MENIKMQPVYGMLNLRETRELAKGSYEYIIKDIKDIKNNYAVWISSLGMSGYEVL